jgi:hypothetical protein
MHFHPGQSRAWHSDKPVVAVIAGTRGGKTSFGPLWLAREMRRKGPGDYLVAAPTLTLIDRAAGPELEDLFVRRLKIARKRSAHWQFIIEEHGHRRLWPNRRYERPSRILFGHGDEPETMEAIGAKATWLDEAGQKAFKFGSWDAVERRLHIDRGRILLTTTPYTIGWLKQVIVDEWEKAHGQHPRYDVIRFDSIDNPAFPRSEWDRMQTTLPRWKFDLFYRAHFTRPAGMIFDCFDERVHKVPPFAIPATWRRWLGLDFGGVHTAGVFLAEELNERGVGTGRLFAYRIYGPAGNATAAQHVAELIRPEPCLPQAVGGSKSEDQWRYEFGAAGLPVRAPDLADVEVGIDRVYGTIRRNELFVFDDLAGLLDELQSYSRVLDDMGEPTREIDEKSSYHLLDALRYVLSYLKGNPTWGDTNDPPPDPRMEILKAPPGVFLEQESRQ